MTIKRYSIVMLALTLVALVGSSAFASAKPGFSCDASAGSASKSCRDETKADFWLAIGKCQNIADMGDRLDCFDEAGAARDETRELCGDQYEARLEVCDDLDEETYEPEIDPADFVEGIDHPYLPYAVGSTWVYQGETEEGLERIEIEVMDETREILGVDCTIVRDTVYVDGEVVEDTFDWYAQDSEGNVWYFGELSFEVEDGEIVNLEGSWESGEDGAHPGIVMPAVLIEDMIYRQEYLLGEAEDMFAVDSLDEDVSVPFGDFMGALRTREWTPVDPDVLEFKYYASGVGLVLEVNDETGERVELIEYATAD